MLPVLHRPYRMPATRSSTRKACVSRSARRSWFAADLSDSQTTFESVVVLLMSDLLPALLSLLPIALATRSLPRQETSRSRPLPLSGFPLPSSATPTALLNRPTATWRFPTCRSTGPLTMDPHQRARRGSSLPRPSHPSPTSTMDHQYKQEEASCHWISRLLLHHHVLAQQRRQALQRVLLNLSRSTCPLYPRRKWKA